MIERRAIAMLAVLGLACAAPAPAQQLEGARPPWLPRPAINPLPDWYEVRGGAWRVPPATVADMASDLPAAAGAALATGTRKYIVQYQGIVSGAVRAVRLAGACDVGGMPEHALSTRFHIVFDGGKCFFDAIYDPAARRFTSFGYHGRA